MSGKEPSSRWPEFMEVIKKCKPLTPEKRARAEARGREWYRRASEHRRVFRIYIAPLNVILPCGCHTKNATEKERMHERTEDGLVHLECPIGGSAVPYRY